MTTKFNLFKLLPFFVFSVTLIGILFSANPVFAGAKNRGYIKDAEGNGKNGVIVQAEVFQCVRAPQKDEDDDPPCIGLKPYQLVEVETKDDASGQSGYYEFLRRVPKEGEEDKFPDIFEEVGMLGCEQTYFYLNVKWPGSQEFTRITSLNNTLDPISKKPISELPIINNPNVKGISKVLAATPSGQICEDKNIPYPCRVENNVAVMCDKTETVCRPDSPSPTPIISPSPVVPPTPPPPPPTPPPPPPPPPACNYNCDSNPKSCEAAKDGCTACIINPNGPKTCQACPPDTNYNPTTFKCEGPTCNQPCNPANNTCEFNRDGQLCNYCNPASSKCESCPPGAEYNPETKTCDYLNACKCDNLSFTPSIFPGQLVRFTANSKIEGLAAKNASQKYIFFQILVPKDINHQNGETIEVAKSGLIIPTKIEDSPTRKRYTANWDFRIPFNIQRGTNYRVIAWTTGTKEGQKLCDANPITTQVSMSQNTAVLAATATQCGNLPTWLCNIADAWKCSNLNLFKDASAKDYCAALEEAKLEPSVNPSSSSTTVQVNGNLQLDQLSPAKTEKPACNTILFKFDELK